MALYLFVHLETVGNSILSLFMPTSAVSFNNGGSRDGMASSVLKWLLTGLMILSYLFVLTMNLESSVSELV